MCTPTFFFQQVNQFFDCIYIAVRDPKVGVLMYCISTLCEDTIATPTLRLNAMIYQILKSGAGYASVAKNATEHVLGCKCLLVFYSRLFAREPLPQ